MPKPRLAWLAAFQICVVGLVVAMARVSRPHISPPIVDDQLSELTGGGVGAAATAVSWGERYWLTAVVAMTGALLLMLPIAWAYVATRERREVDKSLVTTIALLPIAVAAILVIVSDSLAVAFSLAGIAGLVRFRNALEDPRDAMYVILAIAVGLGAGVGALEAAAALSVLFNLVAVVLWKWNTAQPLIVGIALGERELPEGESLLGAISSPQPARHPAPVAEWLEPAAQKPLLADGQREKAKGRPTRYQGILRVHAADDSPTRRDVEEVIDAHAKRWEFETDDRGADGLPTLTYEICLKKRFRPDDLLDALHARLGPRLEEGAAATGGATALPALLFFLLAASPISGFALQAAAGYEADAQVPGGVVTVTAGEHYAAGALHRALLGEHYRDLWTAPVQVPLLDLESYAGGLTPEEVGGGQQTRSLKLKSGDGREYSFRPVDKDPTGALPEAYRGTVVDRLAQDAISAANPAAPAIAAALLDAVGVLNARPQLLVLADQERLGEFRAEFKGTLGYLEERPEEGFAGADEVVEWDDLLELLAKDPAQRVDAEEFLRARLVDHLLGDWDRHRDQWRWAGFKRGRGQLWRPIPRDRDQALVRYDGLLLGLARRVHPKLVNFGPRYPSVLGLAWNAQELDRRLLSSLDRPRFEAVARSVQAALTDSVIAAAIDMAPAAYRTARGPWLGEALRRRRDALTAHAQQFYRLLATEVDVIGSDEADVAEAHRDRNGGLSLVVTSAGRGDTLFSRRFETGETGSVRLRLGGGRDTVRLHGEAGQGPLLEIERDTGTGTLHAATAARRYRVYAPLVRPARAGDSTVSDFVVRDWGASMGLGPRAGYDPDLGLLLGAQITRTDYAFHRAPYGSRVRLVAQYATAARGLLTEIVADVRRVNPRLRFELSARASEVEVVHFGGYGNETRAPAVAGFHDVDHWQLSLSPVVEYAVSPEVRVHGGPSLKYSTTDLEGGRLIDEARPLGSSGFGRVGLQAGLTAASSDTAGFDHPAGHAAIAGDLYPPLWSAGSSFGSIEVEAAGRVPIRAGARAVLAGRVGGRRVWGPFPYDEAAFLGGQRSLRGFDYQRFAGAGMLYGSVELRVPLGRVLEHWVPTGIGVFTLADAGRVWAEGERSSRVHAAGGGGVWLSFSEERNTLSLAAASGAEGTRWYLRTGMTF